MTADKPIFTTRGNQFILDGKEIFLNSGEIHYFRIKREHWDLHLAAAREAGLMAVSSYVPWDWHEPEEGIFDLDGTTLPERDLAGWLKKCKEHGLKAIVKPGPYILAEYRGAGIPEWFLSQYEDQVRMRNRKGERVSSEGVNLFHPIYLEKVTKWYDKIMPFISNNEAGKEGSVIMMQICNEIGLFSWLAHQADYSGEVKERFAAWLKNQYTDIHALNKVWATQYNTFSDIQLPPDIDEPYASPADRARDFDWHYFWKKYYADYLLMLAKMARERGVTVPFYHNLPGWIFGHGYEFPVNITMYDELFGNKSDIIFGVDHIPEFVSHRNMHDDRIINDITSAMQGNKPLFAAEFQSGSREYHVVTSPREMELFYKASIANGLKGWNYYMFSQGRNPARKGYSGDTFYWFNPLTAEGERTSAFPLIQKMSKILRTHESLFLRSERKAEVCVLFYPPYYTSELERPEQGGSELQFVPAAIRRPAYFDGLLKVLQVLNIDYDMADLTKVSQQDLDKYKQVWAFSTDEMNAREQQVLVDYVSAGGKMMIFPQLPDRELSQQPCTILRDALQIHPSGKEIIDSPLIDVMGLKDIKCANPQITYDSASVEKKDVIATTLSGKVCGFATQLKAGEVIHLGTWLGFDTEGHKPVYMALLKRLGGNLRKATSTNDNITVRQRFAPDGSAVLFAGNYFNEEQTAALTYTHPGTGETIPFPYLADKCDFPPLFAFLSPVNIEIAEGIHLLHCSSDLLSIETKDNEAIINLSGERDMPGELVLEGIHKDRKIEVTFEGEALKGINHNNRLVFNYNHLHNKEMLLGIKI